MKILVFGGSGKIGSAVAWDLATDPEVKQIGIVGRNLAALKRVSSWIGSDKVLPHVADVEDRKAIVEVMRGYDAGALALPDRRRSYKLVEAAIEAGLPIVDMLEEYHRRPDPYETEGLELPNGIDLRGYGEWLHEQATKRGVTFLDGMGFAPGLSNVTVGEGIRKLDSATHAVARVGGVPEKAAAARHPLRYMITWAFDHVLREYMIHPEVRRDGKVVEVPAGSDRETFRFTRFGKDELLECAVTPGMPSFMTSRTQLRDFAEKTVRWPGHWSGVDTLKECGLLDLDPVTFQGNRIVPREFLLAMITPRLQAQEGEGDVCVMYNTVIGTRKGKSSKVEYFLWDEADKANGLSSMMRVTGFPVAIAARMLAKGTIEQPGIVPPEDAITGPLYTWFIAELAKRNIRIEESVTEGEPHKAATD
jgi:lysine 6-dehydrogenase